MRYKHKRFSEMVNVDGDALVILINKYIQKYRTPDWKPDIATILEKLKWTQKHWRLFCLEHAEEINWDYKMHEEKKEPYEPLPIPESVAERGITTQQVAKAIKVPHFQMVRALRDLGLTSAETKAALAMRDFGENHFSDSMQMVSSGNLTTAMKLMSEQRVLESRIKMVRHAISEYGPFPSPERDGWVKEETKLVSLYLTASKVINEIQRTWYQGAAELALVQMRAREQPGFGPSSKINQKMGKPSFHPTVLDAEQVMPVEAETPKPEPQETPIEQPQNQDGDEAAAP